MPQNGPLCCTSQTSTRLPIVAVVHMALGRCGEHVVSLSNPPAAALRHVQIPALLCSSPGSAAAGGAPTSPQHLSKLLLLLLLYTFLLVFQKRLYPWSYLTLRLPPARRKTDGALTFSLSFH